MMEERREDGSTWEREDRREAHVRRMEVGESVVRRWRVGRWEVTYRWNSPRNTWGRFGGGWQWALGFRVSESTLLLDLLTFSLTVHRLPPAVPAAASAC